jgi:hypothetical protein
MTDHESAAWEAHQFFTSLSVPYVIIGGTAVQHWGEPRFTQDIDVTVSAPLDDLDSFLQQVLKQFSPRLEDALEFAKRNRVILVRASNGYPLDISLALPGYEDEVMKRAVLYQIEQDKTIRICSAEDLIIHKAVAGRPQDIRDIEGIVYRQGQVLDVAHIRKWLETFADILGRPELITFFETPWQKLQRN